MTPNPTQSSVSIRPVRITDTNLVREITFEMLTQAPHAFGESIAEARARTDQDWAAYVESLSQATQRIAFLAFDPAGVCGFVYGDLAMPEAPPGMAVISHLWVAPR